MFELSKSAIQAWIRERRASYEARLRTLVEIPSISMDPSHHDDMQKCAAEAARMIREFGGDAQVRQTKGFPCVTGMIGSDPKHPTITIYNHLDVQPAGGPEWQREPFRMTIDGDRYYARGATDDKGPALTALYAARYAVENGVPINVRFLWELEEEIGSPNFESFLSQAASEVPTQSVLVSDTIWVKRGKPAVSAGLRGLQSATLTLETGSKDTHSGLTGGAARNPLTELAAVIAACVDAKSGKVKIPGFYDAVIKPTKEELAHFKASGFSVAAFKNAHGFKKLRTNDALDVMKRIWAEPTFEVHGIVGGYQGPGVKTAVPPRAEAKISMRLVPNQSPKKALALLTKFVKKLNPDVKIHAESGLEPYRGVTTGALAQAAVDAITFGFGTKPAFVREGGSIGAVVTMRKLLKAPVMFIGLSLPEHGYHAPNEYFDWGQVEGGVPAMVAYFARAAGPMPARASTR